MRKDFSVSHKQQGFRILITALALCPPLAQSAGWVISEPVTLTLTAADDVSTHRAVSASVPAEAVTGVSLGDGLDDFEDDFSVEDFKRWQSGFTLFYDSASLSPVSGTAGFDSKSASLVATADAEMDDKTRVGVALTLDKTSINGDDQQKTRIQSILGSFYMKWQLPSFFAGAMVTLGRADSNSKTLMDSGLYKGKYSAGIWRVRLDAGQQVKYKGWNIVPRVALDYSTVGFVDYIEKNVNGQGVRQQEPSDFEALELGFGLSLDRTYWGRTLVRRGAYQPELSLMGFYDISSNGTAIRSRFATGGDAFVVTRPKRDKFRIQGTLGLSVNTYYRWLFKAGYRFNWSANYSAHGLSFLAKYKF